MLRKGQHMLALNATLTKWNPLDDLPGPPQPKPVYNLTESLKSQGDSLSKDSHKHFLNNFCDGKMPIFKMFKNSGMYLWCIFYLFLKCKEES